jgi:hypothetical protein
MKKKIVDHISSLLFVWLGIVESIMLMIVFWNRGYLRQHYNIFQLFYYPKFFKNSIEATKSTTQKAT